jgi:aminopeptidase N
VRTFKPALDRVGWTRTAGEADDRTELRAAVIRLVAGIGHDPEARARARSLVLRYLDDPRSLDATTADRLIRIAAEDGDAALYDRIVARWTAARAPEERDRLLLALGRFTDPALLRRTFDLTLSDKVRVQDTALLLGNVLGGARGKDTAWPMVRDRWDEVRKHLDQFGGPALLIGAMGSYCDEGAANEIEQFFKTHNVEGASRTLQQTTERIRSCAALRRAQQGKLVEWLGRAH